LILRLILLLVLFLSPPSAWAVGAQGADAEKHFSFAESLFNEGDFYRAITEYKRLIFFFPTDNLAEKSSFRIAESYYKAKKWADAVNAFKSFSTKYNHSSLLTEALYFKGLAEKELKHYSEALSTFQEIIKSRSITHSDKAIYQSAIVLMNMEEWERARQVFLVVPKASSLAASAHIFSSGLEHMNDIPQKSPTAAGALAAILPGTGHLYTERYRDALVAFLLNGAFIWAAVELFQHENNVAGGIVAFFELGWYSGNIYSAISSAHKFNGRAKEEFIRHLKESAGFSLSYDPNTSTSQLMFSFRY
jgi:tetratricopeptide (TPR) repeat protein